MADENITSADTQEGAQQQATDAQLLDDLTSLQQATEGMDEAQADGQVATNNEGDADNPSMTRPDDEFKDQRGLPEGGTTDTFALDNTDLQNSNEQSTTTDVQFTAQNTTQDATAINLDNVQIEIEGAEGEQSSPGSTRSTTSSTTTTADAPAAQTPTTLTDPAGPTPTDPPPTVPDTTPDTPTDPTPTPQTSGSTESGGNNNSGTSTIVTRELSVYKSAQVTLDKYGIDDGDRTTDGATVEGQFIDSADDEITYTIVLDNTGNQNLSSLVITDAKLLANTGYELVRGSYETGTFVAALDETGDPITVTGTLTNGQLDLTGLVLAPNEALQLVFTYVVTEGDIAGNDFVNTVLVDSNLTEASGPANPEGTPEGTDDADPKDGVSYATTPIKTPELSINKSATVTNGTNVGLIDADDSVADTAYVDSTGDTIAYTITVQNTGNVDLTGVKIYDTMFSRFLAPADLIAVNDDPLVGQLTDAIKIGPASQTVYKDAGGYYIKLSDTSMEVLDGVVNITYTITTAEVADLKTTEDAVIGNTAGADSNQTDLITDYEFVKVVTPELSINKSATVTNGTNVGLIDADDSVADTAYVDSTGDTIAYTITVQNTGNVDLTGVKIYDTMFSRFLAPADLIAVNDDPLVGQLTDAIKIGPASQTVYKDAGGYYIKLSDTSMEVLDGVVNITYTITTAEVADLKTTEDAVIGNTAGADSNQTDLITDYEFVKVVTPELSINKSATVTNGTNVGLIDADDSVADTAYVDSTGDTIAYTITVQNTGNVDLTGVKIYDTMFSRFLAPADLIAVNDDPLVGQLTDAIKIGPASQTVYKDAGGYYIKLSDTSMEVLDGVVNITYTITTAEVADLKTTEDAVIGNTAGADSNQTDLITDYEFVKVVTPELSINKSATVTNGTNVGLIDADDSVADTAYVDSTGDTIAYTITVQNTGNVDLTGVKIYDTMFSRFLAPADLIAVNDDPLVGQLTDAIKIGPASQTVYKDAGGYYIKLSDTSMEVLDGVVNITYTITTAEVADLKTTEDAVIGNTAGADSNQTDLITDYEFVKVVTPELSIWKSGTVIEDSRTSPPDEDSQLEAGDSYVNYEVVLANTGNQNLTNVTLKDEKIDAINNQEFMFDVGTVNYLGEFTPIASQQVIGIFNNGLINIQGGLDVGQALRLSYVYDLKPQEIDGGNVTNIAIVDSLETTPESIDIDGVSNDGIATYTINLERVSDVAISKFADTKFVNGVGSEINYTLTVRNEGNTTLTNVKVEDSKILGAIDESSLAGLQFYGKVYTWNYSEKLYTATDRLFSLDNRGDIIIGNLEVNQYVDIDYTYIVKLDDIVGVTSVLETSVLDYVQIGKRGSGFDSIDMGYGTFKAYQSRDAGVDYDRNTVDNIAAKVFVNVDNTGTALGVNAGVMAGIRNGYSDHLRADFTQSSVKQGTIVFTNAKDVELAFEAKYGATGGSVFVGVIKITEGGDVYLYSYNGTTLSASATNISTPPGGLKTYTFTGADIGTNTFTLSEVFGPGLAQNKIYTLNFSASGQPMKSFDFWVEGDLSQPTATEQIKVVDVQFRSETITYNNISNIAKVFSDEDVPLNLDGQSDEIDRFDVAVTGGSLSGATSSVIKSFGAFAPKVNTSLTDDTTPTITGSAKLSAGETLEVVLNGVTYTIDNGNLTYSAATESWSITVANNKALVAGAYNVTASIIDVASGNRISDTTTAELVIDLTKPTTTITNIDISSDSGASASDFITNINTQNITANLSSSLKGNETLQVSVKDGVWKNILVPANATSIQVDNISLEASGVIKFRVADTSGALFGPITSQRYEVDTTAPSVPSITQVSDDVGSITSNLVNAGITDDTKPTLTITAAGARTIYIYDNGSATPLSGTVSESSPGVFTFMPSTNLASGAHSLTVKAEDLAGNLSVESSAFSLEIDTAVPTINSVSLSATGAESSTLNTDDVVTVTVNMSEVVTVSGSPVFKLIIGSTEVNAAYASGSGSSALTFTYTVAAGLTDATGISIPANALTGTIKDAAGNNANLTLAAITDNSSFKVDTAVPTINSVSLSATGAESSTLNTDDVVTVTVNMSEVVTVSGSPVFKLIIGSTEVNAAYASGSGSSALTFTYTVAAGLTDATGISIPANALTGTIKDAAGNNANLTLAAITDNSSFKVDTAVPTLTSITLVDPSLSAGQSTTVTFEFSEAVTGFNKDDVVGSNGTAADLNGTLGPLTASNGGKTWTGTFTASSTLSVADDNNVMKVLDNTFTDLAGNSGTGTSSGNYTVAKDSTVPTLTSITLVDPSLSAGQSTTVTFEFSEAVTGFNKDDVVGSNGTAADLNGTLGPLTAGNGGKTWTGTFTASSTLSVADDNNVMKVLDNTFTDLAGNSGTGTSSGNYTVAKDSIAPTATASIVDKVGNTAGFINVSSSEIGSAYLVKTSVVPTTISKVNIESLNGSNWNSVQITSANTNTAIDCSSAGLTLTGSNTSFSLFVFDSAGNYIQVNNGASSSFNITNGGVVTPVTLDLNNDGIQYLSTSAGVTYDYNGDGVAESTAWVSPEDGLLALSQEDGALKIVFSTQDGETDLQGLARIYDSNQDGQLDELDTFFNQFGVWQDADSDGVVDSGEFQSLTNRDIVSLDLVSDGIQRTEANGDVFVYGQTTYTKVDGTTGQADDAAFVVRSGDEATTKTIQIGNSGEVVHVPDFGTNDQIDLSTILANAAITRDNLKDYVQLVDGENGTVLNIDTTGHGGEGGWVQVASLDNVHVSQTGVNMFFDPTNQTIDFTQSSPDEWKVEDGDTPV